jgi:2-keto-4-pentenoate hydratase/2-oxohepta-3-ene-1,7-dioic acid hydratase in catechol pathway
MGRSPRIGAVLDEASNLTDDVGIVDLNFGYAALLANLGEGRPNEAADALMPPDMLKYMQSGSLAHDRARQVLDFVRSRSDATGPRGEQLVYARDTIKLLVPIVPRSARDYLTYEEHGSTRRDQKAAAFYHFPMCYKGTPQNFYGPDDPIVYPSYSEWLDSELELAFVINKAGRNIAIEDAPVHRRLHHLGGL